MRHGVGPVEIAGRGDLAGIGLGVEAGMTGQFFGGVKGQGPAENPVFLALVKDVPQEFSGLERSRDATGINTVEVHQRLRRQYHDAAVKIFVQLFVTWRNKFQLAAFRFGVKTFFHYRRMEQAMHRVDAHADQFFIKDLHQPHSGPLVADHDNIICFNIAFFSGFKAP